MAFTCDDTMDDDDFSEGVTCPRCSGWGEVNCHCGGDQCYCDNNGTADCPLCYGEREVTEATYEAYQKRQREMMAAFHGVSFTYPHEKESSHETK